MAKRLTDIRSLARAHTPMCIRVWAGIARNKEAPPAARIAAAECLMDRGWGRAIQHVEQSGEVRQLVEVKLSVVSPALPSSDATLIEHSDINSLDDAPCLPTHSVTDEPSK